MQSVIPLYKPVGFTPLDAIKTYKKLFPEYAQETISYAGRLDPMAEGLLLLLVGEENKKRKNYEALKKTYEFTVLLGIETDSYDILGKIINNTKIVRQYDIKKLTHILSQYPNILLSFIGKHLQPYPPYSSKPVKGKPLYWWARQGCLDEIEIPKKEIEIYSLDLLDEKQVTLQDLSVIIQEKISKVRGDFRQAEILKYWNEYFNNIAKQYNSFTTLRCTISCSSGTYVRTVAHEIGKKIGSGGIALQIIRTQVGTYTVDDAYKLL